MDFQLSHLAYVGVQSRLYAFTYWYAGQIYLVCVFDLSDGRLKRSTGLIGSSYNGLYLVHLLWEQVLCRKDTW